MSPEQIQHLIEEGRKLGNYDQAKAFKRSYEILEKAIQDHLELIRHQVKKPTRRKMVKSRRKAF